VMKNDLIINSRLLIWFSVNLEIQIYKDLLTLLKCTLKNSMKM